MHSRPDGHQACTKWLRPHDDYEAGLDLGGEWGNDFTGFLGQMSTLQSALHQAAVDQFPVVYGWDLSWDDGVPLRADDPASLVAAGVPLLDQYRSAVARARDSVVGRAKQVTRT
jgi:hypothetical protein